jgi:hypothetical protein
LHRNVEQTADDFKRVFALFVHQFSTVIQFSFCCIVVDGQFPIDLDSVRRDHAFLEPDDLEALFR